MNIHTFFATHPVFTVQEFDRFLESDRTPTLSNRKRLLTYHVQRGHLVRVRTGLYGAVPPGADPKSVPVDPYLIAAALTPDAVLGYQTSLAFHGVAHSLRAEQIVITRHPLTKPFRFRAITYTTALAPQALVDAAQEEAGVRQEDYLGMTVPVTSLERTLVDCLDRPRLGGGWEEVWRSYEAVPYLDLEATARYALLLGNATTIARVGYFLQQKRERWMVDQEVLTLLHERHPHQPRYLDRRRLQAARLVPEWNLIVPEAIVDRSWEERSELGGTQ